MAIDRDHCIHISGNMHNDSMTYFKTEKPYDISTFEKGEFMTYLDSAFKDIKNRGVLDLIIDLRNNGGGNNTFSDELLAYIADKPFKFCSKFEVKTSQLTKDFWIQIEDSNLIGLKNQILNHKNGEVFISEIPYHETKPVSDRYLGNVYVLINRYSYSQAALTAAMVQDYEFGILIGEKTADTPSTYASNHQFELPNTHIAVNYPKAFIVRPNGDETFHGVIPEHKVKENVFTKEDEILEYTIKLIRGER
jgi:C-terminal processing protease CtpA/Prc